MNNIGNLMGMINGGNPEQIAQNMIRQNPQLNAIFNQMQQSGLSAKDFTMQFAKQNNIDIQPLMNMLKQRGLKF